MIRLAPAAKWVRATSTTWAPTCAKAAAAATPVAAQSIAAVSEPANWTFNAYGGPVVDPILSATIQIGLYDGDSVANGDQVASFTVDGVDLTAALNAVLEATPSQTGTEVHYTVSLSAAALAELLDGSATVSLTLQGPGFGVLGDLPNNGAGVDFSILSITTDTGTNPPPTGIPEPGSAALAVLGLGLLARRRR